MISITHNNTQDDTIYYVQLIYDACNAKIENILKHDKVNLF